MTATILKDRETGLPIACKCGAVEVLSIASGSAVHHASWRCVACGSFRGWQQKPENAAQRNQQDAIINQLLTLDRLNNWELMFLKSVKQTRKRSGKQIEKVKAIATRLGIEEVSQ